jgi:hypothetical protein
VKRPTCKVDILPSSGAVVKNEWCYTPLPPYAFIIRSKTVFQFFWLVGLFPTRTFVTSYCPGHGFGAYLFNSFLTKCAISGLGGLGVSMLASGIQVRGFEPG